MCMSRFVSVALVSICLGLVAGAAVAEEAILNGDFEAVTAGAFDSWVYGSTGAAGDYNTAALAGSHSASITAGDNAIWQTVSEDGLTDFSWELDFAVLPFTTGSRSLHATTYFTEPSNPYSGNIDSIRVVASGQIQYHNGSGWVDTGLFPSLTTDTGTPLVFDGETPVLNHLEFVGTGYGTGSQSISLTLNGNAYTSPDGRTSVMNATPKYFALIGLASASDYLVDNVSFTAGSAPDPLPVPTGESLLVNGDYEAATDGSFDSWDYYTPGSATTAVAPLEGSSSANIVAAEGGLSQQITEGQIADCHWELDFAALPFSSGSRSLHVTTYETDPSVDPVAGNIDSIRLAASGEIEVHTGSAWAHTGLYPDLTSDTGTPLVFDGETPIMNHLAFTGIGYGTDEQCFELTLNGETYRGAGAVNNACPQYFALLGLVSAADYLVDNVVVTIGEDVSGIPGDLNGDGMVGSADLDIVRGAWGQTVEAGCRACGDPSGDGSVGSADLDIVRANWGLTDFAAIPEPGVCLLMLLAMPAMLLWRK